MLKGNRNTLRVSSVVPLRPLLLSYISYLIYIILRYPFMGIPFHFVIACDYVQRTVTLYTTREYQTHSQLLSYQLR